MNLTNALSSPLVGRRPIRTQNPFPEGNERLCFAQFLFSVLPSSRVTSDPECRLWAENLRGMGVYSGHCPSPYHAHDYRSR